MRKLILLVIVGIFLFSACTPQKLEGKNEEQEICESGEGVWKEFPNSGDFCHNECNKPENVRCLRFMSMGCDCGIGKCWNGKTCLTDEKEEEIKAKINCKIGGCSGELCGEASFVENVATICLYKPEYECYKKYGRCEVQSNGKCGWAETKDFLACIEEKKEDDPKFLNNPLYCEEDSHCTFQETEATCRSCDCPKPINIKNRKEIDCSKISAVCNVYCQPSKVKCTNNKCVIVEMN